MLLRTNGKDNNSDYYFILSESIIFSLVVQHSLPSSPERVMKCVPKDTQHIQAILQKHAHTQTEYGHLSIIQSLRRN